MAAPGGKGLQLRAIVNSSLDLPTSSHGVQKGSGPGGARSRETAGQGSSKDSLPLLHPTSTSVGWRMQANNQFEAIELIYSKGTLQDEEPGNNQRDLLREGD